MDFKEGQEVRLKIKSVLYEVEASLFSDDEPDDGDITSLLRIIEDNSPDEMVIHTEG